MSEPDYKRPFAQEDFRGYFRWSNQLTKRLGSPLYHACHENELREILASEKLGLRSKWKLKLPDHGVWEAPGVWTGLNYFHNGNRYGPSLLELPLRLLNGRHFMVFRRASDRKRYFFVEYEARLPIYSFGPKGSDVPWRKVNAEKYFDSAGDGLQLQTSAIYDIVLTIPLPIHGCVVKAVRHPSCIPGKCDGMSLRESQEMVDGVAREAFREIVQRSDEYRTFIGRFPDMEGESIELEAADD